MWIYLQVEDTRQIVRRSGVHIRLIVLEPVEGQNPLPRKTGPVRCPGYHALLSDLNRVCGFMLSSADMKKGREENMRTLCSGRLG